MSAKPRLLCVDDEPNIVEGFAVHFRKRFQVTTASRSPDVITMLEAGSVFDVVVSDLRMPDMDGVQLLREIRRRSPSTARILLTGYGDFNAAVNAVNEAAVHRFLTKPCRPDQLEAAIDEALQAVAATEVGPAVERMGKLATLGGMAGNIGHEVGNLVASLHGSLAMVREQCDRGEAVTAGDLGVLDTIERRLAEHATHLKNLGKPRPQKIEAVDLDVLVREAVKLLQVSGVLRTITVAVESAPGAIIAQVDRSLFEGAVVNLVKNAAEALRDRAERESLDSPWRPHIDVRLGVTRGRATLAIEDNAGGMSSETRARLFERFFTTKAAGKGTGLGLTIVAQTMSSFGGSVEVDAEYGSFTRFKLVLPCASPPVSVHP